MIDNFNLAPAIDEHGIAAYGVYCMILELLTKTEAKILKLQNVLNLARKYNTEKQVIHDVITKYGLFSYNETTDELQCIELNEALEQQEAKALKYRDNGAKNTGQKKDEKPKRNQTRTKREPKQKQNEPNRIELNRIESINEVDKSPSFINANDKKNEVDSVQVLPNETETESLKPYTPALQPNTPQPPSYDAMISNYRMWLDGDTRYHESVAMNVSRVVNRQVGYDEIQSAISIFIEHSISTGETKTTLKECRKHFGYWILKEYEKTKGQKLTVGEHNARVGSFIDQELIRRGIDPNDPFGSLDQAEA